MPHFPKYMPVQDVVLSQLGVNYVSVAEFSANG